VDHEGLTHVEALFKKNGGSTQAATATTASSAATTTGQQHAPEMEVLMNLKIVVAERTFPLKKRIARRIPVCFFQCFMALSHSAARSPSIITVR
jgi:hypothetical protein